MCAFNICCSGRRYWCVSVVGMCVCAVCVRVCGVCACVRCVCMRVASIGDKVRMSGKWRFCSSVKRQGNTWLSVPSSHYLAPSQPKLYCIKNI